MLHVERSYDIQARLFVEPKSRSGRRRVPIAAALRDVLRDHRLVAPGKFVPASLAFGDNSEPFAYQPLL